jgi:predicted Ser/Thr protein kinase
MVSYIRHAAQGLEEKKQILYLLGPVGGGKSFARRAFEVADAGDAFLRDQGFAGE